MAAGKNQTGGKDQKPDNAPEKKPAPEIDPLAELIDTFGDEIEPVAPEDGSEKGPAEGK